MVEYINISWKYKWTQCYTKTISIKKEIFLAVTAVSREYRFALYWITCEDVSCRQHGPPDCNLFLQKKKQLMANGPLFYYVRCCWSDNIYNLDITESRLVFQWPTRKMPKVPETAWSGTHQWLHTRLPSNQNCLKWNVKYVLKKIGKLDDLPQPAPAAENQPWKRCRLCPTQIDKKTPGVCNVCNRNVCPAHSSKAVMFTCVDCQWNFQHCYQITYVRN